MAFGHELYKTNFFKNLLKQSSKIISKPLLLEKIPIKAQFDDWLVLPNYLSFNSLLLMKE